MAQTKVTSNQGYEFATPAGWKHIDQGPRILIGSETEAGVMIAWFSPGATVASLTLGARSGFMEQGAKLMPVGEATSKKTKTGSVVTVLLQGQAGDGTALKARSTGVVNARGAVVVLAITTPAQFDQLEQRLASIVDSVKFVTVKAPQGGALLRGTLCNYSGSTDTTATSSFGTSRNRTVTFDGKGQAVYGSTFTMSHDSNLGSSSGISENSDNNGTYTVAGDSVSVVFPSFRATCSVIERGNGGAITGLKCGEDLWAASLCD